MGTLQRFLRFEILGSRTSYGFALSLCNDDPEFIWAHMGIFSYFAASTFDSSEQVGSMSMSELISAVVL
jgi:hypothetical protein